MSGDFDDGLIRFKLFPGRQQAIGPFAWPKVDFALQCVLRWRGDKADWIEFVLTGKLFGFFQSFACHCRNVKLTGVDLPIIHQVTYGIGRGTSQGGFNLQVTRILLFGVDHDDIANLLIWDDDFGIHSPVGNALCLCIEFFQMVGQVFSGQIDIANMRPASHLPIQQADTFK